MNRRLFFCCSLVLGALLFLLARRTLPQDVQDLFEGFAALSLGESVPDREMALALEAALGLPVISASSQWVFVDSFGSLEQVPLESYAGRLEPFDPRRDGYAEKLLNFFVRDGRRWFFIPLDRDVPFGRDIRRSLEQKIAPVAGDDFSLELKQAIRSRFLYLILFAPAWGAALFLNRGKRASLLLLGPLMAPLSLWGPPGFAVMALCCLLEALLREPLGEFRRGNRRSPLKVLLAPYRFRLLFSIPLVLILGFIFWFGRFSLPALLNLLCLGGGFFCCMGFENSRRRFMPVPILPPRGLNRGFIYVSQPFLLAALLAVPMGFFAGGATSAGPVIPEWPLLEDDYQAHVQYQTGFSRRPLGGLNEPGYFRYTLGEDGLVTEVFPGAAEAAPEIPPFPLADLSAFLSGWGLGQVETTLSGGPLVRDLIPLLLVFLITGPVFAIRGGKRAGWMKKTSAYYDKRIAA